MGCIPECNGDGNPGDYCLPKALNTEMLRYLSCYLAAGQIEWDPSTGSSGTCASESQKDTAMWLSKH